MMENVELRASIDEIRGLTVGELKEALKGIDDGVELRWSNQFEGGAVEFVRSVVLDRLTENLYLTERGVNKADEYERARLQESVVSKKWMQNAAYGDKEESEKFMEAMHQLRKRVVKAFMKDSEEGK